MTGNTDCMIVEVVKLSSYFCISPYSYRSVGQVFLKDSQEEQSCYLSVNVTEILRY